MHFLHIISAKGCGTSKLRGLFAFGWGIALILGGSASAQPSQVPVKKEDQGARYFENNIRPILVEHCYDCHSEEEGETKGGLLLDRESGWLMGGDSGKAVIPKQPDASLLVTAVKYTDEDMQMPPKYQLDSRETKLLETWVKMGAPGPVDDMGDTEFSRLGDQEYIFGKAKVHWAFKPIDAVDPPPVEDRLWNANPVDRFVFQQLAEKGLTPSPRTERRALTRRLSYDLTGLPPSPETVDRMMATVGGNPKAEFDLLIDEFIDSAGFGEHFARLWLDVARYADTADTYRADTKTPFYFPFAFTYRNWVIDSFNNDKPYDQFVREQLAADLIEPKIDDQNLAALGFLAVGPHIKREDDSIDDWIDTTTRGFLGLTVACARCHDHKFEPIPTADYYSLHGVFSSVTRSNYVETKTMAKIPGYDLDPAKVKDYEKKRAAVDKKIKEAAGKKSKGNQRSVAVKIRDTDLSELLLEHEGAPIFAMVVNENKKPTDPYVFLRGSRSGKGEKVPRRFLKVLDPEQAPFPADSSGRLELANSIADPENPLTARVFVNRIWGHLIGSHLVETPSDFGLEGSAPTHPELIDWLAADFVANGWSIKHLVRTIVTSQTYQQSSNNRPELAKLDPENRQLWRGNRRKLSIEQLRDSLLVSGGNLIGGTHHRVGRLWGEGYTAHRSVYGYINRFNLDPTLRAFDFPSPIQGQAKRVESTVAPQALFTMNSDFVVDQARSAIGSESFRKAKTDEDRLLTLYRSVYQRRATQSEIDRVIGFLSQQEQFVEEPEERWALVAQSLFMTNEFQFID